MSCDARVGISYMDVSSFNPRISMSCDNYETLRNDKVRKVSIHASP